MWLCLPLSECLWLCLPLSECLLRHFQVAPCFEPELLPPEFTQFCCLTPCVFLPREQNYMNGIATPRAPV